MTASTNGRTPVLHRIRPQGERAQQAHVIAPACDYDIFTISGTQGAPVEPPPDRPEQQLACARYASTNHHTLRHEAEHHVLYADRQRLRGFAQDRERALVAFKSSFRNDRGVINRGCPLDRRARAQVFDGRVCGAVDHHVSALC